MYNKNRKLILVLYNVCTVWQFLHDCMSIKIHRYVSNSFHTRFWYWSVKTKYQLYFQKFFFKLRFGWLYVSLNYTWLKLTYYSLGWTGFESVSLNKFETISKSASGTDLENSSEQIWCNTSMFFNLFNVWIYKYILMSYLKLQE